MSAEKNNSTHRGDYFESVCFKIDDLLGRKKWNDALNLLKRGNEETSDAFASERGELFRKLRLAYLFFCLGDLSKAQQYLEQILEENKNEAEALLMMGYFCLIEEKKEDALYYYTRLLPQKNYQEKAQNVLSAIKNSSNILHLTMKKNVAFFIVVPSVSLWGRMAMSSRFFGEFFKNFGKKFSSKKFLQRLNMIAIVFLGIFLLVWVIFAQKSDESFSIWIERQWKKMGGEPLENTHNDESLWHAMEIDLLKSHKKDDNDRLLQASLKDIYRTMEKNIFEKKINAAIVAYNKALLLDPPAPILQKFEILAGFIPKPQWNTPLAQQKDLSLLRNYPRLYRNTYWKLSGKISNVLLKGDILRFRLLLFEGNNLKEIVTMQFQKPQVVPINGQKYQMLARFSGSDQQKNLAMKGVMMQRVAQK